MKVEDALNIIKKAGGTVEEQINETKWINGDKTKYDAGYQHLYYAGCGGLPRKKTGPGVRWSGYTFTAKPTADMSYVRILKAIAELDNSATKREIFNFLGWQYSPGNRSGIFVALHDEGLVDYDKSTGKWAVTEKGFDFMQQNPEAFATAVETNDDVPVKEGEEHEPTFSEFIKEQGFNPQLDESLFGDGYKKFKADVIATLVKRFGIKIPAGLKQAEDWIRDYFVDKYSVWETVLAMKDNFRNFAGEQ